MHNVGSKKLRLTTPGSKQIVKQEIDTFGSEQPPELWLGILPSQPTMMECFELPGTGQQRVPDGATTTVIHPLLDMASTLEAMEVHLPISWATQQLNHEQFLMLNDKQGHQTKRVQIQINSSSEMS